MSIASLFIFYKELSNLINPNLYLDIIFKSHQKNFSKHVKNLA